MGNSSFFLRSSALSFFFLVLVFPIWGETASPSILATNAVDIAASGTEIILATETLDVAATAAEIIDPELKFLSEEAEIDPELASIPKEIDIGDETDLPSEDEETQQSSEDRTYWTTLEPFLIFSSIAEKLKKEAEEKLEVLEGVLVVREKKIRRFGFLRKWLLELESGEKVRISSTLTFLELVQKPGILDSWVRAEGNWSKLEDNKHFRVERLVSIGGPTPPASLTEEIGSGTEEIGSGTAEIGSETAGIGSETVEIDNDSNLVGSKTAEIARGSIKLQSGLGKIGSRSGEIDSDSSKIGSKTAEIEPSSEVGKDSYLLKNSRETQRAQSARPQGMRDANLLRIPKGGACPPLLKSYPSSEVGKDSEYGPPEKLSETASEGKSLFVPLPVPKKTKKLPLPHKLD